MIYTINTELQNIIFIVYHRNHSIAIVYVFFALLFIDYLLKGCETTSSIAHTIGERIRIYRLKRGFSQEQLAELAGVHPTYIGQLERGEKNATMETIEKVSLALEIPLSELFQLLGGRQEDAPNYAYLCYEFLLAKKPKEQKQLYRILMEVEDYKSI